MAGAAYGGGHARIAEAISSALKAARAGGVRVASLDLLAKATPRAAALAKVAYSTGRGFFPRGIGDASALARTQSEDPLLRELISGGASAASAVLDALQPDIVLAVHPIAAAIAAEARAVARAGTDPARASAGAASGAEGAAAATDAGDGYRIACVLPDPSPASQWVHPGCELWFVSTAEARDELALCGAPWAAIAVSGIPVEADATPRGQRRAGLGLEERFTVLVPPASRGASAGVAPALAAQGMQVLTYADETKGRVTRGVRALADDVPLAHAIRASDVVLGAPCGAAAWMAPDSAVPLIVMDPVTELERATVDLLVAAGAAVPARDPEHAGNIAVYLSRHPARMERMSQDAGDLARPGAARAIAERAIATFG